MSKYAVIIERSKNGYGAYVPDLPGCVALGETPEETEMLMREAIVEHITLLREGGEPVPPATTLVRELDVA